MANRYLSILVLILLLFSFLPGVAASDYPNVTLVSPVGGNVSTSTNNLTFICNGTDDENVLSFSFYHDINGTFDLQGTKRTMEFNPDSDTMLLCHFNGDYTCEDGEVGVNDSTGFVTGKFMQGVMINESDSLKYQTSNNIGSAEGSIEFWLKIGFDPYSDTAWLFSTGNTGKNEIQLHANYGTLYFRYYDDYTSQEIAYRDISTWNPGEWHHVAGIWDVYNLVGSGRILDIFLDGSNDSVLYSGGFYSYAPFGNDMYLGSDSNKNYQADSVFDEIRISDRPRTPGEINASYIRVGGEYTNESANWTLTGISDGTYTWNCLVYDNESQGSWSSENYTFSIDIASPPDVNYINLSPSSAAHIDPGVTINVTAEITDPSNVSGAIFQYKYDVDWINLTMNKIGTNLWNASFTTISSERLYYYRIWSNDTLGRANTCQNDSVNVTWDYSWNRNPSSIDAYGLVNSISNVGIITVNNTGDDTLIITLTDDWRPLLDVYYNTTEQFAIAGKSVIDINVTAKYASSDSVKNMTITMSAEPSAPEKTATPSALNTTVTMNSYSGGPYPHLNIVTCPVSVTQSTTGVNLSATVKNIGNETAEDVWFNWTLPVGWTNTSGNVNLYIGNITSKSTNTSDLVVAVSSSALSGISSVCVNASGKGNLSSSDCDIVQVSCSNSDGVCGEGCNYFTDINCERPSVGRGVTEYVGIGEVIIKEPRMDAAMPDRIDLLKGGFYNFTIEVKNTVENTNLTQVNLEISGYPETLIKKIPSTIKYIAPNQTKTFYLEISAPTYIEGRDYIVDISLSAIGYYAAGNSSLLSSGKIVFSVHGVVENVSFSSIKSAEIALEDMKGMNFSVSILASMLQDARKAYSGLNFDKAKEVANEIIELKEKAFIVFDLIKQSANMIADAARYGVRVEGAKKMQDLAKSAFDRGDYERAEERIQAAISAYQLETKYILPLIKFLYKYWYAIVTLLLSAAIISIFLRGRLKIRSMEMKLESIRGDKRSLKKLIHDLQDDYFNRKKISKLDYDMRKRNYEKRLAKLGSLELKLATKIAMMKGRDRRESLNREKNEVEKRMKDLQRDYFEFGKISKNEYKETIKELQGELAEIERDLSELKKPKRSKGVIWFLVLLACVAVFPSVLEALENVTEEDATAAMTQAETVIDEMKALGFGTEYANHTLGEAKVLLLRGKYDLALTTARYVFVIKQKAIVVDEMIDDVELRMHELSSKGHDVSESRNLFRNGVDEFAKENYEKAGTLLTQAMDRLDSIEREAALSMAARENLVDVFGKMIYAHRLIISACVVLFVLASVPAFVKLKKVKKARMMKSLENEVDNIKNSMKTLQEGYFNKKSLGKKDYETRMKKYKKELGRAMERLEAEKVKILKKEHREYRLPRAEKPVPEKVKKERREPRKAKVKKPQLKRIKPNQSPK